MKESSNKTNLNTGGKMSEKGADRAGVILAVAALISALALLVWAASWVKWW